jgi:uncharacterized membrane protein
MGTNFQKDWKKPVVNKFATVLLVFVGLVTLLAGFGAWYKGSIDMGIFSTSVIILFSIIKDELVRMFSQPFSIIGLVMMAAGLSVMIAAVKRLKPSDDLGAPF